MIENGLLLYLIVFAIITALFVFVPKKKKTVKFGIILLSCTLIFEIFVCNFHSFHLLFGKYEKETLSFEDAEITGDYKKKDGVIVSGNSANKLTLEFKDINKPVGTLYIECDFYAPDKSESEHTDYIDVNISAKDVTHNASYRNNIASGQILEGEERTSVIALDLSGDVTALKVTLSCEKGCSFTLKSMELNRHVPFDFSTLRLLLIVGAAFAVYALITFPSMSESYENRKSLFSAVAIVMTVVFVFCAFAITGAYNYDKGKGVLNTLSDTDGNQITKELVDAFEAGQVSLLDKPSDKLLSLENPYDLSERQAAGVSYKWDHLLYNGKYYSYYGIAPVITLFLPFHAITGYYFPTPESVMIFGIIGTIFLMLIFIEFLKLFFPKIPLNMAICSLFIIQMCSGVWFCYCSPLFYEISQNSGFAFLCMGVYFLLHSNVIGNGGSVRYLSLTFATLFLSLAVLSRATLALYCIASLVFIIYGFLKNRSDAKKNGRNSKAENAKYICASVICFAVFGSIQMIYNYLRFSNPLEFGIGYTLTIYDYTNLQYHTDFVAVGLWNYLLAVPRVLTQFPYIFSNYSDFNVNGYYFLATNVSGGIMWRALPLFGYLGGASALKKLDKHKRLRAILLIVPGCIVIPFIMMFLVWSYGYCMRYSVDFAWQMIIGALAIIFFLYTKCKNDGVKKIVQYAFVGFAVIAFVLNFGLIYGFMSRGGYLQGEYLAFARIFDFWL